MGSRGTKDGKPGLTAQALTVDIKEAAGPLMAGAAGLQLAPLTAGEESFCRAYIALRNPADAYAQAYPPPPGSPPSPRSTTASHGWRLLKQMNVRARVQELEASLWEGHQKQAAQFLLAHDLAIVQGSLYLSELSYRRIECCRFCYGTEHKYQWRDFGEYLQALQLVTERAERTGKKARMPPDDSGGYGFDPAHEPVVTCPRCEGAGRAVDVLADTSRLTGPAAVLVKGVRVTANGTELVLHDVDKAKERLMRATGLYSESAGDIARAAAAGAAVGQAAAAKAAEAVEGMTTEQASRLYLELLQC